MTPGCIKGEAVTITCEEFWNPIYQDFWDNFYVEIYDNEPTEKLIEKSIPTILDTSQYTPASMVKEVLQVEPSDQTVNTQSRWTMNLNPSVPLGTECYIKLFFPLDLEYNF